MFSFTHRKKIGKTNRKYKSYKNLKEKGQEEIGDWKPKRM